ncbi:MAG: ATP-binding protein, partial [Parvularculaceae bacterium]
FERYLRIDAQKPAESLMRIRAVYAIGIMMIVSQSVSMIVMRHTYGRWTYDHAISLIACLVVFALVNLVRYYKNTAFYAAFFAVLMIGGTLASALPDHTGINSAMIPVLTIAPTMCAFMAGRRAAIAFFLVGAALLAFLYSVSITNPPQMIDGDYRRETNRLIQGSFAMTLSMLVSVFVSERIYLLVAELREAAERARKAEAATAEFFAKISHEVRTPLNGVVGLAEALGGRDLAEPEKRLADTIRRSGDSLVRILNDVLDLSKIDAGKLSIDPQPTSVRLMLEGVVESWRESARAKGLEIACSISKAAPERLLIDDLRVSQILQNLVSNAVKFTESGRIDVSLEAAQLADRTFRLEFRVSDTGAGVEASMIEKIFNRFDQGRMDTTRRFGGTGLGLPICRELASLMGGCVGVERTGPNGSVFLFTLIARAAEDERGQCAPADEFAGDFSAMRVLVADDNEVNRLVMRELLKTIGVDAEFVDDGRPCVDAASARPFDVIFLDKEMPGMSGLEAARNIRDGAGPSASAIMVVATGDDRLRDDPQLAASGIDDWLVKPVTLSSLAGVLRRAEASKAAA